MELVVRAGRFGGDRRGVREELVNELRNELSSK